LSTTPRLTFLPSVPWKHPRNDLVPTFDIFKRQNKHSNRESKILNLNSLSLRHIQRIVFKTSIYLSVHPHRLLYQNLLDLTVFSLNLNDLLTLPTNKS